jgi:hypothetical protein
VFERTNIPIEKEKQMNKKVILALIVAGSLLVAGIVSAQAPGPGGGWWSGEQVQNVGTATGTIVITAYDMDAPHTEYDADALVDPGAARTFMPTDFTGMGSGFAGSAIVSSDQPIKAIVNVTNQEATLAGGVTVGTPGGKASAQYQGMDQPDTTLYFPLAKHNRYGNTTVFYIQNAGSGAATATAVFSMDDGGVYTYTTPSIPVGTMVFVSPANAGVPTSNTNRANIGSLKVTSTEPLAGVVMEQDTSETVATVLFGTRGFTSADFDDKAYAPVVKNNRFGRFTGIQVQNVGTSKITVTISYVGTSGNCKGVQTQDEITVDPGKSTTAVSSAGNFTANCTGAATLEGTGDFVAIVNETNLAGYSAAGIVYSAMADSSATAKLSLPLFKDQRFNATTGLQIQNVGVTTATNVIATFSCKGGSTFTSASSPQTIGPGGGFLFYKPSSMGTAVFPTGFSANVNCAVIVTSDQPILGIANETSVAIPAHLDDYNYEAFPLTP